MKPAVNTFCVVAAVALGVGAGASSRLEQPLDAITKTDTTSNPKGNTEPIERVAPDRVAPREPHWVLTISVHVGPGAFRHRYRPITRTSTGARRWLPGESGSATVPQIGTPSAQGRDVRGGGERVALAKEAVNARAIVQVHGSQTEGPP